VRDGALEEADGDVPRQQREPLYADRAGGLHRRFLTVYRSRMLSPDQREGGFRLDAMLGEDQLAATWKVTEIATGQARVLRILTVAAKPFQERFVRAASAQRGLFHPNLVQVLGLTEFGQRPAVVTEFVPGTNLATWIAAGPHPIERVLAVFAGLVRGVGAAHGAGLVHRNLKPSKVLVDASGGEAVPKVNDFTLGKVTAGEGQALTQVGITFGTPHYMPPEQFRGVGDVDPRADLFALGALLYEMVGGRRAFEGTDLMDLYRIVSGSRYAPLDSLRPGVPREVVELVDALLAPEPGDRPPTAAAVLERLPGAAPEPALKPAGPTLVATSAMPSAIPVSNPPAEPASSRASRAKTVELPVRKARTLPPESVFVKPSEPAAADEERRLVRQIALAAVVALAFLALIAVLLTSINS
jgi:serine/threonine protein kinase